MRVVIYGEVLNVRRLLNQLYYLCCFYYPYVEVLFSAMNKSASAKPFFNAISRWSVLEQLKCVCFALKSLVRIALSTDFFILILVDTSNACWYLWFLLNHWDFNIWSIFVIANINREATKMIMLHTFTTNIRTWTEIIELADLSEKNLSNALMWLGFFKSFPTNKYFLITAKVMIWSITVLCTFISTIEFPDRFFVFIWTRI